MGGNGKVNIRKTHPALFRMIMTLALTRVALALNFWTSTPTFNPYDISKNIIGLVFFVLGIGQLVSLNVLHNLRAIRIVMASSMAWMLFWGLSNTQQYFNGNASLQLPILYVALALIQLPLALESHVNPMTERK